MKGQRQQLLKGAPQVSRNFWLIFTYSLGLPCHTFMMIPSFIHALGRILFLNDLLHIA